MPPDLNAPPGFELGVTVTHLALIGLLRLAVPLEEQEGRGELTAAEQRQLAAYHKLTAALTAAVMHCSDAVVVAPQQAWLEAALRDADAATQEGRPMASLLFVPESVGSA